MRLAAGCSLFPVQTDGSPLLSAHTKTHLKTRIRHTQPSLEALELFIHLRLQINVSFELRSITLEEFNLFFGFFLCDSLV